jgi:hypothetical protein
VEGNSHYLQLHEQLPWLETADNCSSGSIGFDSHCVASFFISFRPSPAASNNHSSSSVFSFCPSRCRVRFFFKVNFDDEQVQRKEAGSLPALLSLEVNRIVIRAPQISVTCVFQIPCFVGFVDGDKSVANAEQNTFIIRDVPTPMLLPVHLAPADHSDAADIGSHGDGRSAVCKLRAAEVTGMGIPGKVWDAGLALAGAVTSSPFFFPRIPCC